LLTLVKDSLSSWRENKVRQILQEAEELPALVVCTEELPGNALEKQRHV
jgi:hypothetical protein